MPDCTHHALRDTRQRLFRTAWSDEDGQGLKGALRSLTLSARETLRARALTTKRKQPDRLVTPIRAVVECGKLIRRLQQIQLNAPLGKLNCPPEAGSEVVVAG